MDVPDELLSAFPPAARAALDLARRHVDDDMLMVIARADYGLEAGERFAELRPIRDTGDLSEAVTFPLHEVLSLTRWSQVNGPEDGSETRRRQHRIRSFACATLLLSSGQSDGPGDETDDSSLGLLLASALVLGDEWSLAAARFVTWRLTQTAAEWNELALSLALLILAVRLRSNRFSDGNLGAFAVWAMTAEGRRGNLLPFPGLEPPPQPFSVMQGFWDPMVVELGAAAKSIPDEGVRTNLLLCSQLIAPDWR